MDREITVADISNITSKEFYSYLNLKKISPLCQACNNKAMGAFGNDETGLVTPIESPLAADASLAYMSFVLFCQECGNTLLLNAQIVCKSILEMRENNE